MHQPEPHGACISGSGTVNGGQPELHHTNDSLRADDDVVWKLGSLLRPLGDPFAILKCVEGKCAGFLSLT